MERRRVLVTGSSRGIGAAIASRLASDGFHVVLHGREQGEKLKTIQGEISESGGQVTSIAFDVKNREQAKLEIEKEIESHGAFYGVVSSAGIYRDAPLAGMSGEEWDLVLRTNLDGVFNVLQPLLMPMLTLHQGGRVVLLSSVSGIMGNRGQANYAASKSALFGLTKSLAQEVGKRGVLVNCVAPGIIQTEMTQGLDSKIIDRIPLRRMASPSEVAGVVSFLFSPDSSYVTGQVISVNGGMA